MHRQVLCTAIVSIPHFFLMIQGDQGQKRQQSDFLFPDLEQMQLPTNVTPA